MLLMHFLNDFEKFPVAIIIIIIIIVIIIISFMQGIYTYIPETNHVPREHSVAAVVFFFLLLLLYHHHHHHLMMLIQIEPLQSQFPVM